MSLTTAVQHENVEADYAQYRTLSLSAIATLVLGIVSLTGLLIPPLLFLPVIGALLGLYSVFTLRRRTEEFTGLGVAQAGLALCVLIAVVGIGWNIYDLATEVPEGFQRISFYELQPDPNFPQLPIPPTVAAKICRSPDPTFFRPKATRPNVTRPGQRGPGPVTCGTTAFAVLPPLPPQRYPLM